MPQCRGAAAQPRNAGARIRERQHAGHLRGRPHAAKSPNGDEATLSIGPIGGSEPALRGAHFLRIPYSQEQAGYDNSHAPYRAAYAPTLLGVFASQNEQCLSLESSLEGPPAAGHSNNFALVLARAAAPADSHHAPNQAPRRTQHMARQCSQIRTCPLHWRGLYRLSVSHANNAHLAPDRLPKAQLCRLVRRL